MNKRRQLSRLTDLAQIHRMVALSGFAVLARERQAIEAQREALAAEQRSARKYAAASPETSIAAARFDTFVHNRTEQITDELKAGAPRFEGARDAAARAVGRHAALVKLAKRQNP